MQASITRGHAIISAALIVFLSLPLRQRAGRVFKSRIGRAFPAILKWHTDHISLRGDIRLHCNEDSALAAAQLAPFMPRLPLVLFPIVPCGDSLLDIPTCLGKLNPGDRELVDRRYQPGATPRSVAEESRRSVQGTKKTLHRIRSRLLACIRLALVARDRP
jgi:hypothetical protein